MKTNRIATRKDVAELAGVSETIVSYVINNNRYVHKDKRTRVLQAVKELNYTPNTIARALKGKTSKHILFIVDNTTAERFGTLIQDMDKIAYRKGMIISLISTTRHHLEFAQLVRSRQLDGVIISSMSFPDEYIEELVKADIPVVLLETKDYSHFTNVAKINTGLYQGMKNGFQYLYDQGRRNFIYIDRISQSKRFSDMSDYRYRGFVEQMRYYGLDLENSILKGYTSDEECLAGITGHLEIHKVDAIIGRNDHMACLALKAVSRSGMKIPEEVGVVGFDNSSICKLVTPELTSIKMNDNIAEATIEMIIEMRLKKRIPEPRVFHTELVVRKST